MTLIHGDCLKAMAELEAENAKLNGQLFSSVDWLRAQTAEAELATAKAMLEEAEHNVLRVLPTFAGTTKKLIRRVFADLRTRAERETP